MYSSDGGGSFAFNDVTAMGLGSPAWDASHQLQPITLHDAETFGQRVRLEESSLLGESSLISQQHVVQSLEAWVKVLDAPSGSAATLVKEGAVGAGITLYDSRYGSTDGVGHMAVGGHCVFNSSAGPPPLGQWMHLVAVVEGDDGADKLYVNGDLVSSVTCNSTNGTSSAEVDRHTPDGVESVFVVWANMSHVHAQEYDGTLTTAQGTLSTLFTAPSGERIRGQVRARPHRGTASFLLSDGADPANGYFGRSLLEVDPASGVRAN